MFPIAIIDSAGADRYTGTASTPATGHPAHPVHGQLAPAYNTGIYKHSGITVTKDELRAELERQAERYKEVYGGEVTTYAAQPEPERKPWRKRATVQDQAFSQELEKMEKELRSEEP
ncbi:hypothetical protein KU43P_43300 [Pseudomonas sp. KU43P]|nr:hypothetical protein KU43P_43300 [Pseudomonas sp. KU43P]